MNLMKLVKKRDVIKKGIYLLKSTCCDLKSCDLLTSDIQDTRYECNDLFSKYQR